MPNNQAFAYVMYVEWGEYLQRNRKNWRENESFSYA